MPFFTGSRDDGPRTCREPSDAVRHVVRPLKCGRGVTFDGPVRGALVRARQKRIGVGTSGFVRSIVGSMRRTARASGKGRQNPHRRRSPRDTRRKRFRATRALVGSGTPRPLVQTKHTRQNAGKTCGSSASQTREPWPPTFKEYRKPGALATGSSRLTSKRTNDKIGKVLSHPSALPLLRFRPGGVHVSGSTGP